MRKPKQPGQPPQPRRLAGTLVATGRVTKPGRRIALTTAEVTDSAGRLVATATSNCLILSPA
jgi:acyl-coenzyme A thioesterase PaaI-like protein